MKTDTRQVNDTNSTSLRRSISMMCYPVLTITERELENIIKTGRDEFREEWFEYIVEYDEDFFFDF